MKFSKLTGLALGAALGAIGLFPTGAQAGITASAGDVILGFRASGGTGASTNYTVNLGQASQFTGATSSFSLGSISADLTSIYGSGWETRTDLFFGVIGATDSVGTDAKTIYASKSRPSAATTATAWSRASATAQGTATSQVNGLRSGLSLGTNGTATSSVTRATNALNSWSSYLSGGASFSLYNPTIESTVANGAADFFALAPGSGAGSFLGTFVLYPNGTVRFVADEVTGDLVSGGTIAVSNPTINVAAGATTATVIVTRTGGLAASSVVVNTVAGTATSPADFTAISTQTVNFAAGGSTASVDVPVTLSGTLLASAKSFTVVLSGQSSGATLGATTATITIPAAVGGTISVSTPNVLVNNLATVATVTLTRTGGSDPATVQISTTDGTATSPANFTAITNQTASFAAGINTADVLIPLSGTSLTASKKFTATISGASVGASVGTPNTATIRLRSATPDNTLPTLAIVKPAATPMASVDEIAGTKTLEISGTVTEANLESLTVSINGGAAVATTITTTAGNKTWKLVINAANLATAGAGLQPGGNTVTATATDLDGNITTTAARSFKYIVKSVLTVAPAGTGAGALTFSPTLSAGSLAIVGQAYTVTAAPNATSFFSSWSSSGSPAISFSTTTARTTTFTFAAGQTLIPTYLTTPFTTNVVGLYNGIVKGSTTATDTQTNAGSFAATVSLNTGAFSGKLILDGVTAPVVGVFNNVSNSFTSPTVANGYVCSLTIDTDTPRTISGTVTKYKRSVAVSVLSVDAIQANTTFTGGPFVIAFSAPDSPAPDLLDDEYPHGNGVATITIGAKGVATVKGTLADGTAFTSVSTVTAGPNEIPVFASFASRTGSIVGEATIVGTTVIGTDFRWFRSANASQYYPYGYANGDTTGLTIHIAAGSSTLGSTLPATVTFSGGEFAAADQTVNVGAGTSTAATAKMVITAGINKGEWAGNSTYPGKHIIGGANVNGVNYGYILSPLPDHTDGAGEGSLVDFGSLSPSL